MMKCIVQKSRNINAVWWNLSDCCLGNGILDHCQYTLLQKEFNCKTLHARKLSCNTEKYKEIQQKYRTGAYEIQRGTYTVAFQIGGPIPIRASTNVLGLRFQTPGAPPSLSSITVIIKMISLSCWLFQQLKSFVSKVNISKWQQSFAICQGCFKRLRCNSTSACFQQSLQLHPISLFISSFKSRKCNISAVVFPLKYLQS